MLLVSMSNETILLAAAIIKSNIVSTFWRISTPTNSSKEEIGNRVCKILYTANRVVIVSIVLIHGGPHYLVVDIIHIHHQFVHFRHVDKQLARLATVLLFGSAGKHGSCMY